MRYRRIEIIFLQRRANAVRYHHRTMPAAGAADANCQVRFALALIPRHEIQQQIDKPTNSFIYFGFVEQILYDLWVFAGKTFEFFLKIRVRQMPDVEHQIKTSRTAVFVSETYDLNFQRHAFLGTAEFLQHPMTQRVNRIIRGVNYKVRQFPNILKRKLGRLESRRASLCLYQPDAAGAFQKICAKELRPRLQKIRQKGRDSF